MKRVLVALLIASLPAAPALAKKKKAPPTSASAQKSKEGEKAPPPGDKRTNEGAQGRTNATEGAASDADSPQFQRRP
jgi:hypothetical protein